MELLLRAVDRTSTPGAAKVGESLKGDVIAAEADGHAWSVAELTSPEWRLIRVPITQAEIDALTSPERIPANAPVGTIGWRRLWKVDVDALIAALPVGARAALSNDKRTTPILDATPFLAILRAAVVQRAASV